MSAARALYAGGAVAAMVLGYGLLLIMSPGEERRVKVSESHTDRGCRTVTPEEEQADLRSAGTRGSLRRCTGFGAERV